MKYVIDGLCICCGFFGCYRVVVLFVLFDLGFRFGEFDGYLVFIFALGFRFFGDVGFMVSGSCSFLYS